MRTRLYVLSFDETGRCWKVNGKPVGHFNKKRKRPQYVIYLMRCAKEILYVGEAKRGFYRCIQGFMATKNQTVRYPWRDDSDLKCRDIECLVFDGFRPYGLLKKDRTREAIEADVAATVRISIGRWPQKLTGLRIHGSIRRSANVTRAVDEVITTLQREKWITTARA